MAIKDLLQFMLNMIFNSCPTPLAEDAIPNLLSQKLRVAHAGHATSMLFQ